MSIGNTMENKILDAIFNNVALQQDGVYVSLHTSDPGEDGNSGTGEVSGGSYARQQVTNTGWDVAASGALANTNDITWTNMPAVTITHVGMWNSSTLTAAANWVWGGALSASKTTNAGDTFKILAGDLDVTLD